MNKPELLRKLRASPILFGRMCVPQMFSEESPSFHYEVVKAVLQPNSKTVIVAPRGHAKSSLIAGVMVMHHLLCDEGPKFVVLVSKTQGHANRLLTTIKDAFEYSASLRALYGYWGQFSARVWREDTVTLKDGSMILARGTGQQVIGLKNIHQRPTFVILDDPEDLENTKTDEAMEKNLRWYLAQLDPVRDPRNGRIVVIGTPQHQRCMVEVLSQKTDFKALRYKALQDDGTVLWPEMWPRERLLAEKEALNSINRVSVFYREYQCEVVGDEDQLFKQEYLQPYEGTYDITSSGDAYLHITRRGGVLFPTPLVLPVNIFMGIDPASSTKQHSDYSTIVPIAVDNQMNRYVLPYFRGHVSPMKLAEKVLLYYRMYKPIKTRIESVGYQEMLREYLRAQEYIPGLEIKENPRTQKSARLESMEPFFAGMKFFLQPSMSELRDELLLYPRSANDDLLDGLFYATKGTYKPFHEVAPEQFDDSGHWLGISELPQMEDTREAWSYS